MFILTRPTRHSPPPSPAATSTPPTTAAAAIIITTTPLLSSHPHRNHPQQPLPHLRTTISTPQPSSSPFTTTEPQHHRHHLRLHNHHDHATTMPPRLSPQSSHHRHPYTAQPPPAPLFSYILFIMYSSLVGYDFVNMIRKKGFGFWVGLAAGTAAGTAGMAGDNHPHWSVSGIGCGTAGEGTAGMLSGSFDFVTREKGFWGDYRIETFIGWNQEVTFKTRIKTLVMEDLVSEGHDLLSSRVILSEDDYWRGCKKASNLENEFYTYVDKLDPLYKGEIDRIYLDEVCEVSNEGGVTCDSESSLQDSVIKKSAYWEQPIVLFPDIYREFIRVFYSLLFVLLCLN
ncbi:hypothetical protein Tco_0385702 [Tanacetum coccineum]